jgi:hypothetical protein
MGDKARIWLEGERNSNDASMLGAAMPATDVIRLMTSMEEDIQNNTRCI